MLQIKNLHATIDGKKIIKGLSLDIPDGEVHAIMAERGGEVDAVFGKVLLEGSVG